MERNLGVIINYCSNDREFIEECIDNVRFVSNQVIIPICEQYFDDTNEDYNSIKNLIWEYSNIKNVSFVVYPKEWESNNKNSNYGHNVSRWVGVLNLHSYIDDVLFLDSDEIINGFIFKNFYNYEYPNLNLDAIKFSCYWYFRDKKYRAKVLEECGLLCKNENLINKKDLILNAQNERNNIFDSYEKRINNYKYEKNILINHYSWVRTKDEMIKKVKCWGHKNDKDWVSLIEEEFKHEFNGTDFVHGYKYDILD